MKPQFRASNGVYFTKQLFYEYSAPNERYLSLYSLKDEDFTAAIKDENGNSEIRTFPSLRRLFLEEGDITGYRVASKYFGAGLTGLVSSSQHGSSTSSPSTKRSYK